MSQTLDTDLNGMVAVVTGASSGIGKGMIEKFSMSGARVVIHYNKSESEAKAIAQEIMKFGRKALTVSADLSTVDGRSHLIDTVYQSLGRVDIWVNNAGADILTTDEADWDFRRKLKLLIDVDLMSTIELSRTVGERMKAVGGGTIINIGWDQANNGMEGDSGQLFGTVKAAIMAFSKSLALTLAPEVRVNCIAPGWIKTKWGQTCTDYWNNRVLNETPAKRWGAPEDVAEAALFLAKSSSSFITGQTIYVNGGAVR